MRSLRESFRSGLGLLPGVLLALLVTVASTPARAQGVRTVPVTASGIGVSQAEAAQNAVINAVAMVSGERISANQTVTQTTRQRTDSAGGASEQTATDINERINRLTRGVVKAWSIVSTQPTPDGTVQVTVSAQVAVYQASNSIKRFRVAVVPGRMSAGALPQPGSAVDALITGLQDTLVASRKFAVLDRRESAAAEGEYRLIESRRVPVEELVRLQSRAVADALVVVNAIAEPAAGDPQRPLRLVAEISVLDYASGQLKGQFTQSRRISVDTARNAATQLGRALGNDLLEYAFPPMVVGIDGDMLTIDAGDSRFSAGEVVRLLRFGNPVKDPATGESRGFTELPVGEARIVHTTPMISVAQIDRALLPRLQPSNGIVARRAADKPVDLGALVRPTVIDPAPANPSSPSNPREKARNEKDW